MMVKRKFSVHNLCQFSGLSEGKMRPKTRLPSFLTAPALRGGPMRDGPVHTKHSTAVHWKWHHGSDTAPDFPTRSLPCVMWQERKGQLWCMLLVGAPGTLHGNEPAALTLAPVACALAHSCSNHIE